MPRASPRLARDPRQPAQPNTLAHEIGKRHPFDHPEQEAYLNILRTASLLSCQVDRLLRAHRLSESAYNTLRILRGHASPSNPGVPSQTIGRQLIAPVPDITRLVDRLVAARLARRSHSPADRRLVLVAITPKGLDLLARLDQPILDLHRQHLAHMSRADLRNLNRLLVAARAAVVQPAPA